MDSNNNDATNCPCVQSVDAVDHNGSNAFVSDTTTENGPVKRRFSRNSLRRCAVYNSAVTKAAALLVKEDEESEEAAITGLTDLTMANRPGRQSFRRSAVYNSVVTQAAAMCVQEDVEEEEEDEYDELEQNCKGTAAASSSHTSNRRRRRSADVSSKPDSPKSYNSKRPRRVSNDPPTEVHCAS